MIGNRSELWRGCFGMSIVEIVRGKMWSPLHYVVDFPRASCCKG
jgi:hypothetical protein